MKKLKVFLSVLGVLLIIVPFCIPGYHLFELLILLCGIIALSLGIIIASHHKVIKIIFVPLLLICLCFGIDFINAKFFKGFPVIARQKWSSANVSTYNSLFYRTYKCGKKKIFDWNYKKSYMCGNKDIGTESVNLFLANPEDSFNNKKGRFVHLEGKISSIVGESGLILNEYEEKYEKNGYVVFNENKKVIVDNLQIDPTSFYVYDYIEVIGLVDSIVISDESKEIHLTDAKIIPSSIYDDYELIVKNNYSDETVAIDGNIYYKGIDDIQYKYDERDYYELSYLLIDKRETFENLVKGVKPKTNEEEKADIYKLEDYTLVKCNNDNLIFVNKYLNDFEDICKIKEEKEDK